MLKVSIKNTRCRSGVFTVNFEEISHIVLVFPVLNLNKWMPAVKVIYKLIAFGKLDFLHKYCPLVCRW